MTASGPCRPSRTRYGRLPLIVRDKLRSALAAFGALPFIWFEEMPALQTRENQEAGWITHRLTVPKP
jgi:hypothetical protein